MRVRSTDSRKRKQAGYKCKDSCFLCWVLNKNYKRKLISLSLFEKTHLIYLQNSSRFPLLTFDPQRRRELEQERRGLVEVYIKQLKFGWLMACLGRRKIWLEPQCLLPNAEILWVHTRSTESGQGRGGTTAQKHRLLRGGIWSRAYPTANHLTRWSGLSLQQPTLMDKPQTRNIVHRPLS